MAGYDEVDVRAERDEVRVRGVVFYNLLNALRVRHGQAATEAVLEAMEPLMAERLEERRLDPAAFYPARDHREIYRAVREVTQRGPDVAREFGCFAIRHNMPLLYRMFLHALTPEFAIKRVQTVFRQYFDRGEVRVIEQHRKRAIVDIVDCPGFDDCLWLDVLGGCEGALITTGARNLEIAYVVGGNSASTSGRIAARWD